MTDISYETDCYAWTQQQAKAIRAKDVAALGNTIRPPTRAASGVSVSATPGGRLPTISPKTEACITTQRSA